MEKKKVEIVLGGSGHEITRSKFTCEELDKVRKYCNENDTDMDSVLTNELEEVLENKGSWYDCDDEGHFMGANLSCKLYVTIGDDEYEFETKDANVEFTSEDYPDLDGGILVSFITWEKGTLDTCEFEIEGDFDISKLTLVVSQIETSDSVYEIIKEMSYDGESLIGEGFSDTTGKAFEIEMDSCDEDED